jgi:hypothetical protein
MAIASNYGVGAGWTKATPKVTPKVAPKAPAKVTPKQTALKVLATPKADSARGLIINDDGSSPVGTPMVGSPGEAISRGVGTPEMAAATPVPFTLEGDPVYQAALASGRSAFSFAQAQALADKQNQETGAAQQRRQLDTTAAEGRRRLAGNYAARGMAGGAAGALSMAEARANAEQVAARTSITDQISALNNQYLQNFGNAAAEGYDWTGTLAGSQYKTQAAQAAIQAQLARYGVA